MNFSELKNEIHRHQSNQILSLFHLTIIRPEVPLLSKLLRIFKRMFREVSHWESSMVFMSTYK